jgi:methionine-rich copper-binding protein CopC
MMSRTIVSILLALMALPEAAQAHAMLDHASPLVGSTVATAPRAVALTFTQKLEPAFSTVRVVNASGARVDQGKAQVDPGSRTVLSIGLKPLPPGTYKVFWKVLSVDTHATEGNFSFTVGQ